MYLKEFEIRWNDLDANMHLANSSYVVYMSHTRMAFLEEHVFHHKVMREHNIGPVVFNEHIHYFKEAVHGKIRVSFELGGISDDSKFFRFLHNFYDEQGRNIAFCEIYGGWIDIQERRLISLPDKFNAGLRAAPKSEDFRVLTKADMRKHGKSPRDLH